DLGGQVVKRQALELGAEATNERDVADLVLARERPEEQLFDHDRAKDDFAGRGLLQPQANVRVLVAKHFDAGTGVKQAGRRGQSSRAPGATPGPVQSRRPICRRPTRRTLAASQAPSPASV